MQSKHRTNDGEKREKRFLVAKKLSTNERQWGNYTKNTRKISIYIYIDIDDDWEWCNREKSSFSDNSSAIRVPGGVRTWTFDYGHAFLFHGIYQPVSVFIYIYIQRYPEFGSMDIFIGLYSDCWGNRFFSFGNQFFNLLLPLSIIAVVVVLFALVGLPSSSNIFICLIYALFASWFFFLTVKNVAGVVYACCLLRRIIDNNNVWALCALTVVMS